MTTLSQEFSAVGISSGAIVIAPDELLDRDLANWAGVESVDFVALRHRADASSMADVLAAARRLTPRVMMLHTHRHGIPAALGQFLGCGRMRAVTVDHTTHAAPSSASTVNLILAMSVSRALVCLTEESRLATPARRVPLRGGRHVVVIPNGVDVARFNSALPHREPGEGPHLVGMTTRLVGQKDIATLLRAMSLLDPGLARLAIAGDGEDRRTLQALRDDLGLRESVEFLGHLPRERIPGFMSSLDVYVQATNGETLSMSMLEAAAAGRPIVASRVSGVENVFTDGVDALFAEPGSAQSMAEALLRVLRSPELALGLSSGGRELVRSRYSSRQMALGYADLLADVDPRGPWDAAARRLQGPS